MKRRMIRIGVVLGMLLGLFDIAQKEWQEKPSEQSEMVQQMVNTKAEQEEENLMMNLLINLKVEATDSVEASGTIETSNREDEPKGAQETDRQEGFGTLETSNRENEPEGAQEKDKQEESEAEEYENLAIANVCNYVNIRKEPNTDSEVLGKIYQGAVAQVLERTGEDGEWFHILSGSLEGYIKAEYFYYGAEALEHIDEVVTEYAEVIADRLNVRKEKDTSSSRIGYIDRGERVEIIEDCGEWLKVAYTENKTGYVSAQYVTVTQEFVYGISIEEERRLNEERKALEEREKVSEESKPENKEVMEVIVPEGYETNEELRSSIVEYAKQYLGNKYVHGGKSLKDGTDCSGFTCYIYKEFGYSISRTPDGQYTKDGRSISYQEIQPGDIVCYGNSKCTHVGLYIGEGKIIHEANSKKGVVISNVDYMSNILGYKSIID